MRAVINGATGAIGMALIRELIAEGHEVLVLCRESSPRSKNIPNHSLVKKIDCPLDKMSELSLDDNEPYDVFYHFAWEGTTGDARNDMYLQNRNVTYTLDAVALASRLGCKIFIGAGSQAEYGRVEGKLTPKTPTFPENGYGIAKLCASQMSRIMCASLGIRHIWTRILSVYGPNDTPNSMVMSTIRKLRQGEKPCFTAGEQVWDYLYSGDAAKAFIALAKKGRDGEIYCLGSGDPKKLCEYIKTIGRLTAPDAELGIGEVLYANKQVMYLCADIEALTTDTGFVPKTSFEDGIKETLKWYDETACNKN